MPWSLPRRTARVIAFVPKRWRMSSSTPSTGPRSWNGRASWTTLSSERFEIVRPSSVMPLAADPLERRLQEAARDGEDRRRVIGGLIDRVRPGDPLEALEPQAQHDGSPDAPGVAQPARHAVDDADEDGIERLERSRIRPSARCDPIDRRRRPVCTRRASRLWARAWMWCPPPGPRIATSAGSGIAAMSPTVCTPRAWSLAAVLAPTPQTRSIGSGCRNASSRSGGTRAAHPASTPHWRPWRGTSCGRPRH